MMSAGTGSISSHRHGSETSIQFSKQTAES
jgi:hypothetical protein